MATAMLENGADIRFIQEMLGHAKVTSTEIYTHVAVSKLRAIHAATHPAANIEKKAESEQTEALEREELLSSLAAEVDAGEE